MVKVVMVTAWVLMVSLLAFTGHAQVLAFSANNLLFGALELTRSSSPRLPCTTPELKQGLCMSATLCKEYQPLIQELQNTTVLIFFRERVCRQTSTFIHVCCPIPGAPVGPSSTPDPQRPPIAFNQQPAGSFNRPSQRPNARQPSQQDFDLENDDEKEEKIDFPNFQPPPPLIIHNRPPTTRLPTSPPPQLPTIPIMSILMSPDREPSTPNPQSQSVQVSQTQDQTPTAPPVPQSVKVTCGKTRTPGTTPWVVGVGVSNKSEFRLICGGALISDRHVIIAAHCLHTTGSTHVRLGGLARPGAIDVPFFSWVQPNYNHATRDNDLALLTLANPVTFNDHIQPVCLPFPYRLDGFQNQEVQVVGLNERNSMQAATVEVVGLGQCRRAYRSPAIISNNKVPLFSRPSSSSPSSSSLSFNPRITSAVVVDRRHLCGSPAPSASSSGSCLSDHGAPLFYHDKDTTGLHYLVGVSSLGDGCAAGPGLYTRIGAFLPGLAKELAKQEPSALSSF